MVVLRATIGANQVAPTETSGNGTTYFHEPESISGSVCLPTCVSSVCACCPALSLLSVDEISAHWHLHSPMIMDEEPAKSGRSWDRHKRYPNFHLETWP